MVQPHKEDIKEINLFGDKSIKEEAYRQKILQLEKELAHLETVAKDSHQPAYVKEEKSAESPHRAYYENLISFDKRLKKEQEFFEKRSTEITEQLDTQVQRLLLHFENSFRHKIKLIFVSVLAATVSLITLFLVVLFMLKSNMAGINKPQLSSDSIINSKLSYVQVLLQTQAKYRHHYQVVYINSSNGVYTGEIELADLPDNKWFMQSLATDVMNIFKEYAGFMPAEISFVYKGKLYLKAYLSRPPQKLRLQYFY